MSLSIVKPLPPKRFNLLTWARETLERGVADGSIPRPRPAPAWMIAEDKYLRAEVRKFLRSSGRGDIRSRVSPCLVNDVLDQLVIFGLADALEIYDGATCVPIALASKIVQLVALGRGIYYVRSEVWTSHLGAA